MEKFEIIRKIIKVGRCRPKGRTKEQEFFTLGLTIPKDYLTISGIHLGDFIKITIEKLEKISPEKKESDGHDKNKEM